MVVSWDPAKLRLQGGSVTSGEYARSVRWFDDAAGVLHVLSSDPAMTRGIATVAGLAFDVVGGAGTTTTISLEIEQLVGIDFRDDSGAGVALDAAVVIE